MSLPIVEARQDGILAEGTVASGPCPRRMGAPAHFELLTSGDARRTFAAWQARLKETGFSRPFGSAGRLPSFAGA